MMKKIWKIVLLWLTGGVIGGVIGSYVTGGRLDKEKEKQRAAADKYLILFRTGIRWLELKQRGIELSSYLKSCGYKSVAIYGMGYLGERLYEEIKGAVDVRYGIDLAFDTVYSELEVVSPDSVLDKVDAVIVTSITSYKQIQEKLMQKTDASILSLEDILYSYKI